MTPGGGAIGGGDEPIPRSGRTLRRCEVTLLAALYWPVDDIDNAVNVAELESGFRTDAHNVKGEDSRGLWQINVSPGAHPGYASFNLYDPQINAYLAHAIWVDSGWRAWLNAANALGLL